MGNNPTESGTSAEPRRGPLGLHVIDRMHELLLEDPRTSDSDIARRIFRELGESVDPSTVYRHRTEQLGLPSGAEAKKRGMGPLSAPERNRLARLLDDMMVPGILKLDRHGPVDRDGITTIPVGVGSGFRIYVENGAPVWCWFPDADWKWLAEKVFQRLRDPCRDEFQDSLLNIQQQMLTYVSRATKHRSRALSMGGATIQDVVNAQREGLNPIGLPDANAVLEIVAEEATISRTVDEFQSRLKSASGI